MTTHDHNHAHGAHAGNDHLCCRELIAFLQDYADGTLHGPIRESFEQHVNLCLPCKDYLKTYMDTIKLARACSAGPKPPCSIPEALVQSIMNALRENAPGRSQA